MIKLKVETEGALLITMLVTVLSPSGRTSVEIQAHSLEEAVIKLKQLLENTEIKPPF